MNAMNRIEKEFKENKKVFIPYMTLGLYGGRKDLDLCKALLDSGANILELGIPFSDPLADGPVIQEAHDIALGRGTRLKQVFGCIERLRRITDKPLVFLTYYNIIYHFGIEKFFRKARNIGIDGIIVPDEILDESKDYLKFARKFDVDTIFLGSPTTSVRRIKSIDKKTRGFLYYVSLEGTTGPRKTLPPGLIKRLRLLKREVRNPLCVGFGISRRWQAQEVYRLADGVIVGSALVDVVIKNYKKRDVFKKVQRLARQFLPRPR